LLNPDSEYSILSKHKIGIVEEGVKNSDSSESVESEMSSSEDETDAKETKVKEVLPFGSKRAVNEQRPATVKELEQIQFQEEEFLSKFRQFNEDIFYVFMGSLVAIGFIGWVS
jgi:hypothetical protein